MADLYLRFKLRVEVGDNEILYIRARAPKGFFPGRGQ